LFAFRIETKFEVDVPERFLYLLLLGPVNMIAEKIKGNGTIHGATVHIDIA
jgi:hypothetical protein